MWKKIWLGISNYECIFSLKTSQVPSLFIAAPIVVTFRRLRCGWVRVSVGVMCSFQPKIWGRVLKLGIPNSPPPAPVRIWKVSRVPCLIKSPNLPEGVSFSPVNISLCVYIPWSFPMLPPPPPQDRLSDGARLVTVSLRGEGVTHADPDLPSLSEKKRWIWRFQLLAKSEIRNPKCDWYSALRLQIETSAAHKKGALGFQPKYVLL